MDPTATHSKLAAGGVVVAFVALVTVLGRSDASSEPPVGPEAGREVDDARTRTTHPSDEELAAVESIGQRATGETPSVAVRAPEVPPRERFVRRASSSVAKARLRTEPAEAVEAVEPPETVPFYVIPIIDSVNVLDLDHLATIEMHARLQGEPPRANARVNFNLFNEFLAGEWIDATYAPDPLVFHFDHPGALPVEVLIRPGAWSARGDHYVARPTVLLDPIETTLRVRASTHMSDGSRNRSAMRACLIGIASDGCLTVYDDRQVRRTRTLSAEAVLRVRRTPDTLLVVGLAKHATIAPELLAPHIPSKDGHYTVAQRLRARPYQPELVRFIDPFEDAMEGVRVDGVVQDELIAIHDVRGDPVSFEGHVFVHTPRGPAARFDGRYVGTGDTEPSDLRMLVAPRHVGAVSDGSGMALIENRIEGIYEFTLSTDLVGGSYPARPYERSLGLERYELRTYNVCECAAPVGGVEILPPAGLSPSAPEWRSAKIEVSGGGQSVRANPDEFGRARCIVPPLVNVTIHVEVAGKTYEGAAHPLSPGSKTSVSLRAIHSTSSSGVK